MRRPTPPRERRGGTCPPARPGGSSFENENRRSASTNAFRRFCFASDQRPTELLSVPVFQLPGHFLEYPSLIARQAVEALLDDLVEHHVELLVGSLRRDLRARRWR
jgi:hypothetical protein